MPAISSRPRPAILLAAVVTTAVALALAGCGPSGTATGPASSNPSAPGGTRGQGGGTRQPGVSGLIAAVSGKTLQVQGTDGQTAVSYTDKTTITDVAGATAADLKTGLCATVRSAADGSSGTPTDQLTASSVTLSPAVSGRCDTGFGGGGRPAGSPSGAPSGAPAGPPSGNPSGGAGGRGGFGFGANGLVSSVSGTTFVVENNRPAGSGAVATKITVTTTGSTIWSQVKAATSKAIVVGRCALAIGKTSDTGAVAATSLRISPAANGSCSTGRGQGRSNGPGGAGTGQPGNGQGNG